MFESVRIITLSALKFKILYQTVIITKLSSSFAESSSSCISLSVSVSLFLCLYICVCIFWIIYCDMRVHSIVHSSINVYLIPETNSKQCDYGDCCFGIYVYCISIHSNINTYQIVYLQSLESILIAYVSRYWVSFRWNPNRQLNVATLYFHQANAHPGTESTENNSWSLSFFIAPYELCIYMPLFLLRCILCSMSSFHAGTIESSVNHM